jgi:hypothetical protein
MSKHTVELDDLAMNTIERIAIINGKKKTKPELVNLSIEIAVKAFEYLDEETLYQVFGLKK